MARSPTYEVACGQLAIRRLSIFHPHHFRGIVDPIAIPQSQTRFGRLLAAVAAKPAAASLSEDILA
jgi:hypothetical protein